MKVVLVSPSYHPAIGGLETHVKEIAERLIKEVNTEVYTLDHTSRLEEKSEINGVTVRRFGSKRVKHGVEIPSSEFVDALKYCNADIIHLHSFHTLLPYFTFKAANKSNHKMVITPHYHGEAHTFLDNILFTIYKPMLSDIAKNADRIICVSRYEKSLIMHDFRVAEGNVVVIPNGIDLAPHKAPSVEKDSSKILCVGRLEKYKNVDKLVRAFKLLAGNGFTLTIVGDGSAKQSLSNLVTHLNLMDKVRMKSNLSREEVINEYASSGIFVMPSSHEAYGIAAAEALCMGLKVIVASSDALSEFVKGGYAYGIAPPVTPEKIASAILDASNGNAPVNRYVPPSWDDVVKALLQVYRSITGQ